MIAVTCLLAASVLGGAHGLADAVYEANNYVDTVLGVVLPQQVSRANLTSAPLPGFTVGNESDAVTVRIDGGVLFGLGKQWQRRGDCRATQWRGENITTTCHATLDGMILIMYGVAENNDAAFIENVTLIMLVKNSSARIYVTEKKQGHTVHLRLGLESLPLAGANGQNVRDIPSPSRTLAAFPRKQVSLAASQVLRGFIENEARQGVLRHAFSLIHLPLPL
ncbi:uncharacterized protein LOC144114502 isoform X2 [Amblyomma americanum]